MTSYQKIDMETWARREHYQYYTEKLKVECNMTALLDVKNLLDFCHSCGYKFYASLIYLVTKVVNRIENFRMFRDADGHLCVWEQVVPNYTIFHEDDKTFSDCWTDYSSDFDTFYRDIITDMQTYKDKKGIKAKAGQPANFYCISGVPWTSFTAFGSRTTNGSDPAFFPIITMGKYEKNGDKITMPVNLLIAHAVADGYHAGLFFQYLQEELDGLQEAAEKQSEMTGMQVGEEKTNMTEKEKMLNQMLYDANYDGALKAERIHAKELCHQYNQLHPAQEEEQREILLQLLGKTGENFCITAPFWCDYGYNIVLGENFYSNHNMVILDCAKVTFGDNVFVAPNCGFYTAGHPIDLERRNQGLEYAYPITVGNNVWIGAGVQVMPGVTIGDNVVIGGGSVVVKDIPSDSVAVGNPCKVVRKITEADRKTCWDRKTKDEKRS